ncbi:MAG: AgmX/PglI C-terminal domain-containing protein [Myxococcota bacterium]
MAKKVTGNERRLRLLLLWHEEVVDERELPEPGPVVLGDGAEAVFPLPEGAGPGGNVTVLEPHGEGYQLRPVPGAGGAVWLSGHRREMGELASVGAAVPLGPSDYGVVSFGPVSLFFQHVRAQKELPRQPWAVSASLVASMGLAAFVALGCLVFSFWDLERQLEEDPLELPPDLVAKYMVVPPPEETAAAQQESGTETEDPGLRGREETGGKRHEGDEGRVGREDAAQEDTEIAGEVSDAVAAKVRGRGLLGALTGGGEGNAIAEALDVPSVGDILGGMNVRHTTMGRGSGGAGLRGAGEGGGGEGPGSLFGAGDLGTGIGAGKGGGVGRGKGGAGAPGRKAREVKVSVSQGAPQVSGYLSREQILRVVRANQAAIKYCYEVQLQRQPNLRGKVGVFWRIGLSGNVETARIASSTLRDSGVEGCILRQVRRWRFPKPDGGTVKVTFPFLFGVGG